MHQRLKDMKLLRETEETITVTDFRKNPGDIFDQVQMGKTFKITKSGKVVAVLSQPEPSALELMAEVRRLRLIGS